MNIKDLTLKELVTARLDLVDAILSGEHEGTTKCFVEKDSKGRMKRWTEEHRDIADVLISSRVDDYTYHQTGEVNEISLKKYDKDGMLEKEKIVKHKNPSNKFPGSNGKFCRSFE